MIKHKYNIYCRLDYTKALLGCFSEVMPEIGIQTDELKMGTITSNNKLEIHQKNILLETYQEGLSKLKLPKDGKLVITCITYIGTFEYNDDVSEEINIIDLI